MRLSPLLTSSFLILGSGALNETLALVSGGFFLVVIPLVRERKLSDKVLFLLLLIIVCDVPGN